MKRFLILLILLTGCSKEKHTYVPAPDPDFLKSIVKKANCDKGRMVETWFDLNEHYKFKCQRGGYNCFGWKLIFHVKCYVNGTQAEFKEVVSFGNSDLEFPQ